MEFRLNADVAMAISGWFVALLLGLKTLVRMGRESGEERARQKAHGSRIARLETELSDAHQRIDDLYKERS